MNLVFNECSLGRLPETEEQAVAALNTLLETALAYRKATIHPQLAIESPFSLRQATFTASGYYIDQWLSRLEMDRKRVALSLLTRAPFIRDYPPFYFLEQQEAVGFAYATDHDLLTVSYDPFGDWQDTAFELLRITEEGDEEFVYCSHLPGQEHLQSAEFKDWVAHKRGEKVAALLNIQEFWEQRESLFPNLVFLPEVWEQIERFSVRDKVFQGIQDRLAALDEFMRANESLNLQELPFRASGESESTLNQFADLRTFRLPDTGEMALFEWHIKLPYHRIHFLINRERRMAYVGYIGKHLKTSKFS